MLIFGKAKIENSNVWKSPNKEFQCLDKRKSRIPILEMAKRDNSNVWKRQK